MLNNLIKSIFMVSVIFIVGCEKDKVDTEKPTIQIIQPQNHTEYEPGQNIELSAVFRDNIALGSYKIEVHINDDGHTHGKKLHTEEPWTYFRTGTFEPGLVENTINHEIEIPDTAEHGEYHIGVFCTDASGNESVVFVEIDVVGDH